MRTIFINTSHMPLLISRITETINSVGNKRKILSEKKKLLKIFRTTFPHQVTDDFDSIGLIFVGDVLYFYLAHTPSVNCEYMI